MATATKKKVVVTPTPKPTVQTTATAPPKEVIGSTTRASIKAKAEAGIAMDSTSPEKARLYAQDQARIKYLTEQRAKNGEALSSGNAYKDGLYLEARKNLTPADKAYYNPDNVMLRQQGESEARMNAMNGMLQNQADASMQSQEALLSQARDQKILELQKALNDAVTEGKISVRDAEAQFEEQKGVIEQEAYNDTERTELVAQDRGIGNSQQMLGLQASDNMRKNSMINTNMTTRDRRINDISDRLNNIKNKSSLDIAGANADFGYGMANAQGQVNAQMAQNMFNMNMQDFEMTKGQQFSLDQAGIAQKNQQAILAQQQGYTQQNMQQQQGYTQQNMQTAQNFDLAKMSTQQKYQLEQMAKSFGYDLGKMSVAQQYQLANMATSFGYDMSMQNDGQAHQEGMQQAGFGHDASMQNDAQSFQGYQNEQSRMHAVNMFGMEQTAKAQEIQRQMDTELASYGDPNSTAYKLREAQLKSSVDAVHLESQAKLLADVMGKGFADHVGNPPKHPGKNASKAETDKYNNAVKAYNKTTDSYMSDPKNMNTFFGALKEMEISTVASNGEDWSKTGFGAMKNAFTDVFRGMFGTTSTP